MLVAVRWAPGLAGLLAGDAATIGSAAAAMPIAARPLPARLDRGQMAIPARPVGHRPRVPMPAADCGAEIKLYLRAKLGFCNCTTGVSDDAELDRVGDLELLSDKFKGLGRRAADRGRAG